MADVPSGPIPPPPPPPPPEGTPPGPGSLRPRTLGEILSAAFEIYKNNAQGLIVIVALIVVPLSLISALILHYAVSNTVTTTHTTAGGFTYTTTTSSFGPALLGGLIAAIIGIIIGALLQAAIIRAGAEATIGDPVDVEASYRYGLHRLGSVILVGILFGLAVAFGFILLIIPGILALVYFGLSIPSLVVEDKRGTKAMSRSANLVSGHFWHAFGVLIVAYIIVAVVSAILGAIGGNNWVVAWIFRALAQIITTPFSALVSVLLYLDLRARKEALTTDVLRSELASGM